MTTLTWVDVMGLPEQLIEATITGGRVLVDEGTLGTMESSILAAQMTDAEDTAAYAAEIRSTPRDPETGLFDVTGIGGGWDMWQQMIVEEN